MKNSNVFCLIIHVVNHPRDGSGKGSKNFKTTYRYKNVKTKEEIYPIIESHGGLSEVHTAYHYNKLVIKNNNWVESFIPD